MPNYRRKNKPLRVILQLIFLFVVVGWLAYIILVRGSPRQLERDEWRQRDGFVALSYGGIARSTGGTSAVSRHSFRQHLEALTAAGYVSLTTDDVVNFYKNGLPLPDRAVYLMFEEGRKDSAIFGQEALSATGMQATMFVQTRLMLATARTFLGRREVGALSASAFWEIGTQGNSLPLPQSQPGRPVFFLSDLKRNRSGRAAETLAEYTHRAKEDYAVSFDLLKEACDLSSQVFVFMPANTMGNTMDERLYRINRDLIESYYPVAFTREGAAFNHRHTPPRELSRLRIQSDATPEEFMARIVPWLPDPNRYVMAEDRTGERWIREKGSLSREPGFLELSTRGENSAFAWLGGSVGWRNVDVSGRLSRQPGMDQSIYLRYLSRNSFLRLRTTAERILLQERSPAQPGVLTLLNQRLPPGESFVDFHLSVKNERYALEIKDGLATHYSSTPLLPNPGAGRAALEVIRRGEAPGRGRFIDLVFQPIRERWKLLESDQIRLWDLPDARETTAIIIPLDNASHISRGTASILLQAAEMGIMTYALPPAGKMQTQELDAVPDSLPEIFQGHLWSGSLFRIPSGSDWTGLKTAMENAKQKGLVTGICLPSSRISEFLAAEIQLPADILLLWLDAKPETPELLSLQHRYEQVLSATATPNGTVFTPVDQVP
ncbi:MAG: hypothetical protein LBU79_06660 [Planctomycetota bacterium]|jgi:hypothetical protein|nr:hypothetical protein [Planctomycetota bacterium]